MLTGRLSLRPLAEGDAGHFARLLGGDSGAVRLMSHMPDPCTEAAARRWIAFRTWPDARLYAVRLVADPEAFIGAIGIGGPPAMPGLGYWIGRPYWNRGYATEAALAVLDQARTQGVPRVRAETFVHNPASARVLAKLGFVVTGRIIRDLPQGGRCALDRYEVDLMARS